MKMPWENLEGPAKVLAISIAILLVAAGLCGAQLLIISGNGNGGNTLTSVFMTTGILELGVMVIAGITAVGALLAWISTSFYNVLTGSRGQRDRTQKLFNDSDDQP